ncbi:MAG TPA: hypothetical protein PKG60_15675 [Spirochaetota bacterium]|nr:hypothetical protein [Spirochaetota bacterium]
MHITIVVLSPVDVEAYTKHIRRVYEEYTKSTRRVHEEYTKSARRVHEGSRTVFLL